MKTIELFCGTKSFSKVMEAHGHETHTIDNDKQFAPDVVMDALTMVDDYATGTDIFWASPPCEGFSVASIGANWTGGYRGYEPKSETAERSIRLAKKTVRMIQTSAPKWWFIENPQGLLKKMDFMEGFTMHTISYCHYGDDRMKPTNIWTNAYWWTPRPECHNRNPRHAEDCCCHDHEAAPRGSRTGTQGRTNYKDRSRIPSALFEEILEQVPKDI